LICRCLVDPVPVVAGGLTERYLLSWVDLRLTRSRAATGDLALFPWCTEGA
jgi:hypothetical protein